LVVIVNIYRDCNIVGNIPGSHFVTYFSTLPSHS